jgi:hypothetical protein
LTEGGESLTRWMEDRGVRIKNRMRETRRIKMVWWRMERRNSWIRNVHTHTGISGGGSGLRERSVRSGTRIG